MRREADATVLAFDFGTRRIGVAVGNTLMRVAHPLATIAAADPAARWTAIRALLDEWRPQRLVVGLPVHADATPHAMTARAREFALELADRFALPVALEDERHTSEIARDALAAAGRGGRAHRPLRDRVAAQIILQAWFDGRHDA
ncbi:MAG TPA: Holliday junction resolvase RuvX [Casimicrobiaceae bacterium]|nr:Holliday junction resolvase RuvX [Casimicrobiaceae bacterium]